MTWTASKVASWVTLSSTGGTLAAGTTATVTASTNSGVTGLAAGSYTDTVTFTNTTTGTGNTTRPVSLTVTAANVAGPLTVTPAGGLTSSWTVGSTYTPVSQAYTLTNTGTASMTWTASKVASWVTLSSTGGTLAAGTTATVTASTNSGVTGLAAGSYTDTVTFTNTSTGTGNTTRPVSLTVTAANVAGPLTVTPAGGLTSSWTVGSTYTPVSQAYTLTNTGTASMAWTASKVASWVTLSSTGGTLAAGTTATVTASTNSGVTGLAAGSYTDTVTFTNGTSGTGNTTRAVSLTVNPLAITLTGITISGPASVNESTATATYTATATWSDSTTQAVTAAWSVSPTTYATINPSTGVLTAGAVTANQTVVVSASYTSGTVTKTASATVNILDVPAALAISTASLPAGTVGTSYGQTFTATGGTAPYSWSVSAGTLPAGLNLSAAGVLGGTPTTAATSSFTVQVTDGAAATATKVFSLTINNVPATGAVTITPADGATDLPVNTVVTGRVPSGDIRTIFNKDTFTLKPGVATSDSSEERDGALASTACVSGGVVQGSISYNDSHTRARFTPNCTLEHNMTYIGEIASGGGVRPRRPRPSGSRRSSRFPTPTTTGATTERTTIPMTAGGRAGGARTGPADPHRRGMTTAQGPTISRSMAISDTSSRLNQAGKPEGVEFPDGMVSFRAEGVAQGTSATFKVTFPSGIAPGSKVYQVDAGGFHEVAGAVIAGDTVTMTVTNTDAADGSVLVNPVGVAAPAASGTGSIDLSSASGGGGCSVAVRTGSGGSYIDGTLILAGLGMAVWGIRIRRRRG